MYGCVVDLVYSHADTQLIEAAKARGVPVVDGLELLVRPGRAQLRAVHRPCRPGRGDARCGAREADERLGAMSDWPAHLRPVGAESAPRAAGRARAEHPEDWDGVTAPSRRGGSTRFLTDVLVELGYCDRERVEAAIAEARAAGHSRRRSCCSSSTRSLRSSSRGRSPSATGSTTSTSACSRSTWPPSTCSRASAAKRYSAVPVAYADEQTLVLAMSDPANVLAADDISPAHPPRGQAGGRLGGGHPDPDLADEPLRGRGSRGGRGGRGGRQPAGGRRPPRVRRGRAGDQARALDHRRGRRARRVGHPLRADGPDEKGRGWPSCACGCASTACCPTRCRSPSGWSRA